jgi:hypothetical protein
VHDQALRDFAERTREVARLIQQGDRPADQSQPTSILYEIPKAIPDPELRNLELQMLNLAREIDRYLEPLPV